MIDAGATAADTNTATDTNGDGIPNFQADFDPPIFNTTDNSSAPSGQDYSYYGTWPYNLNNSRTDQIAGHDDRPHQGGHRRRRPQRRVEDLTFLPKTDSSGNPVLDTNGHQTYQAFHNGRVDIIPDGTSTVTETVIAHPPTVYNTSVVDRIKLLSVSPNAQYLETDPNNNDTDGDGLSDGEEDANHNGIVDLAIIDRNQVDANGNFVVLATFTGPTPVGDTVQGSAGRYRQRGRAVTSDGRNRPPNATRDRQNNAKTAATSRRELDRQRRPQAKTAATTASCPPPPRFTTWISAIRTSSR